MADENQSVQLSGFGKGLKITGPNAFLSALIVLLVATIGYLVHFNLKSWGDPFPIKNIMDEHAMKNSSEHTALGDALERNTYVQWACSTNNTSAGAKEKCSSVDLMRPESLGRHRRYRVPPDGDD